MVIDEEYLMKKLQFSINHDRVSFETCKTKKVFKMLPISNDTLFNWMKILYKPKDWISIRRLSDKRKR
ncbi:MAG: hypothetical protein Lokiarch_09110 [Candidatus Lokiarchaeum sp. GC14_75]|nr:MAG: hypothetical protein Lokiarch_09110 [Candidatus Lokiarchaeum sp. GC14_75]